MALQHRDWLESRKEKPPDELPIQVTVHPDLQRILAAGHTRLAIEYEGWSGGHGHDYGGDNSGVEEEWVFGNEVGDLTSSPKSQRPRGRKRVKEGGEVSENSDKTSIL